MSTREQAKSGFKTFLVTFGVSVLVFGVFYYLISSVSEESINIEEGSESTLGYTNVSDSSKGNTSPFGQLNKTTPNVATKAVLAGTDENLTESEAETMAQTSSGATGGADTDTTQTAETTNTTDTTNTTNTTTTASTTTSTTTAPVPETGDFSITLGMFASISLLVFFVYILVLNPRRYALSKFEKRVLDEY